MSKPTDTQRKQELVDRIIVRARRSLLRLETVPGVEVQIKLSKPLRNHTPSVTFAFESSRRMSEISFYSSLTGEVLIYDREKAEVITGYSYEIVSEDDFDAHFARVMRDYV
jgi:hypothetical protein